MRSTPFFFLFFSFLALSFSAAHATDYVSAGSGLWSTTTTWTPNGNPNSGDNVTILATHTVSTTNTGRNVNNIIVNGTLRQINVTTVYGNMTINGTMNRNNSNLTIRGDFTFNGTLTGTGGRIIFSTNAKNINGNGTISGGPAAGEWQFQVNTSIASSLTISKAGIFTVNSGVTVTNNANITLTDNTVNLSAADAVWTNASNSSLSVSRTFAGSGILNASSSGNTITYLYFASAPTCTLKVPSTSTYHNLTVRNGGTKFIPNDLYINGDFTIGSTGTITTLNMNGKNLTIKGNLTTAGTTPAVNGNTGTVTFDGSAAQTISGTISSFPFTNITVNNPNGVSSSVPMTISGATTLEDGTLSSSSIVTFNGSLAQSINGTSGSLMTKDFTLSNANGLTTNLPVAVSGTMTLTSGRFYVNSDLDFNGTSAQVITGGSGDIYCMATGHVMTTNSTSVTTSRPITIDGGTISVLAGTLATGSVKINLLSYAGVSGRIGDCTGGTITGNQWFIERYIPSSDTGWQDISCPINGANISSWDSSLYMSLSSSCPDGMAQSWQSVYYWDASAQDWVAVSSCSEPLSSGRGFEIWLATTTTSFTEDTIRTIGTPKFGPVSVSIGSANGEVALVGNPYASPIDWTYLATNNSNVKNYFSIFDETTHNYESWDCTGGPCAPTGGKLAGSEIPAYQGFWVENLTGTSTFNFAESDKVATTTEILKAVKPAEIDIIRMRLYSDDRPHQHNSMIRFVDGYSESYDQTGDIRYRKSRDASAPSLTLQTSDNQLLSVGYYPVSASELHIPIQASVAVPGSYHIDFRNINLVKSYDCLILEDEQTGQRISLDGNFTYNFTAKKEKDFIKHFILRCYKHVSDCGIQNHNSTLKILPYETGVKIASDHTGAASATLLNILGQPLQKIQLADGQTEFYFDIHSGHGIYFISITTEEGISTRKFVY